MLATGNLVQYTELRQMALLWPRIPAIFSSSATVLLLTSFSGTQYRYVQNVPYMSRAETWEPQNVLKWKQLRASSSVGKTLRLLFVV